MGLTIALHLINRDYQNDTNLELYLYLDPDLYHV